MDKSGNQSLIVDAARCSVVTAHAERAKRSVWLAQESRLSRPEHRWHGLEAADYLPRRIDPLCDDQGGVGRRDDVSKGPRRRVVDEPDGAVVIKCKPRDQP